MGELGAEAASLHEARESDLKMVSQVIPTPT